MRETRGGHLPGDKGRTEDREAAVMGEDSPKRRGGRAQAPADSGHGMGLPSSGTAGGGGRQDEPGAVRPEDNRRREKMALVRNWSDDDGLQMDYREKQSQEDAEEAEGSRGTNGEKVLERLRQSREGVKGRARGQDFTARQEGKRQFPHIWALHAWGEPHDLGAKSTCAGGKHPELQAGGR